MEASPVPKPGDMTAAEAKAEAEAEASPVPKPGDMTAAEAEAEAETSPVPKPGDMTAAEAEVEASPVPKPGDMTAAEAEAEASPVPKPGDMTAAEAEAEAEASPVPKPGDMTAAEAEAEAEASPVPKPGDMTAAEAEAESSPIPLVKEEEEPTKKAGLEDLSLRPFTLEDVDDFMAWACDDRVSQFCSWNTFTSRDDVLEYLKVNVLPHPWYRAICADGRPVGSISVSLDGRDWCRGEVGYVLASEYWGRGIVPRALMMAVASVFQEVPQLERVEALVDVENAASQRVMEKAGFLWEGMLRKYFVMKGKVRDAFIYSFLSTDPFPLLFDLSVLQGTVRASSFPLNANSD